MPLYEYSCGTCERPFEMLVSTPALADAVVCRFCGGSNVRRLISAFAARSSGESYAEAAPTAPRAGGCCGGACGCGH